MTQNLFMKSSEELQALFPYYVYSLTDPRDQEIFYIGKGQGNRMHSHWAEVCKAISRDETLNSQKQQRLAEIAKLGKEPIQLVVGRYETEEEALSVEATLINWVYGYENLTNLSRGFRNAYIRPKGSAETIHGIDIPKPERSTNGEFMQEKIGGLSSSGAYDFMNEVKQSLSENGLAYRDFSHSKDRPYDPGESNGYLGLLANVADVDFLITTSKTRKAKISIATTDSTRENLTKLAQIIKIGQPKNIKVRGVGRYVDFDQKLKFEENDSAGPVKALMNLSNRLNQL